MRYKKIWDKTLLSNEELKHEFAISRSYLIFKLILSIIFGLIVFAISFTDAYTVFLVVPALFIILASIFYYSFYLKVAHAYAFTNKRVIIHTGWLSTEITSVDYDKITDIKVREPFFERIITSSGDISINTAGTHQIEIGLRHVDKPYELKKKLDEIRDNASKGSSNSVDNIKK